jgi:hypothetical protein
MVCIIYLEKISLILFLKIVSVVNVMCNYLLILHFSNDKGYLFSYTFYYCNWFILFLNILCAVYFQGRFEILSLSGSYTLSDNSGMRTREGGLSVSLAGPDGRVIGGAVAGLLTAAGPIQVWYFLHFFLNDLRLSILWYDLKILILGNKIDNLLTIA